MYFAEQQQSQPVGPIPQAPTYEREPSTHVHVSPHVQPHSHPHGIPKSKRDNARHQYFLGFRSAGEGQIAGSVYSAVRVLLMLILAVLDANGRGGGDDGDSGGQEDNDNAEGEDGHFDGLAMLGGPTKIPSKSMSMSSSGVQLAIASAGAKDVAPLLLNLDLLYLAAVLDKADVVIEVLDARDPLAHHRLW